jgi:hypothetical protein
MPRVSELETGPLIYLDSGDFRVHEIRLKLAQRNAQIAERFAPLSVPSRFLWLGFGPARFESKTQPVSQDCAYFLRTLSADVTMAPAKRDFQVNSQLYNRKRTVLPP